MSKLGCWLALAALCACAAHGPGFAQTSESLDLRTTASVKAPEEKKFWVGLIPPRKDNIFWRQLYAGALRGGEEFGAGVIWQGPADADDAGEQADAIRVVSRMRIDALIVSPLPDPAVARAIRETERRNIRVILVETVPKGEDYTSLIASDGYKAGMEAGLQLGRQLDGKGKVLLLRYSEKAQDTRERERGFLDVLRSKYPTLEQVSIDQYAGETDEAAQKKADVLIKKFGASLNGVFTSHEITTFAMLRALKNTGKADKVCFIGFDASPAIIRAVESGDMKGTMARSPFIMGYLAVKTAVAAARGETVGKRVSCNALWVTKKALEDENLKTALMPDLSRVPQ